MEGKKVSPTTFQLEGIERKRVMELRHMKELEQQTPCSIAKVIKAAINEKYDREISSEEVKK